MRMHLPATLAVLLAFAGVAGADNTPTGPAPPARNPRWAVRVELPGLANFHRVSPALYRGAQAYGLRLLECLLAAFGHIGGQLALAGWWLLPTAALLKLLPFFAAAALFFGAVNGIIVARLFARPAPSGRQSATCIPPSIPLP